MLDYFYEWMKNIACYMVLITAFMHVIPNEGYRKYIRMFTGLVLVLLLLTPVFRLFDAGSEILHLYESGAYEKKLEEIREATDVMEDYEPDSTMASEEGEKPGEIYISPIRIH